MLAVPSDQAFACISSSASDGHIQHPGCPSVKDPGIDILFLVSLLLRMPFMPLLKKAFPLINACSCPAFLVELAVNCPSCTEGALILPPLPAYIGMLLCLSEICMAEHRQNQTACDMTTDTDLSQHLGSAWTDGSHLMKD